MAQDLGASGVLIAPCFLPVPDEQTIFDFYQQVSGGLSIPMIIQDYPPANNMHMSVNLLLRIVEKIPSAACIKEEAVPNPSKIAALLNGMTDRKVPVLQGMGALYGFFSLERGACGFMTGFGFPEVLIGMLDAAMTGDMEKAWLIYHRFLPLIVFEQQPGVAIRKEIYRMRGLIDHNRVRHPGGNIDNSTSRQLTYLLQNVFGEEDLTKPIRV
jgi:4-hydroxy-tetrahydrodipicolinate synthase